jgi:hypothetical protein
MNSEESTTGGITASPEARRKFAESSIEYNAHDKVFVSLFGSDPRDRFTESELRLSENTAAYIKSSSSPAVKCVAAPSASSSAASVDDAKADADEAASAKACVDGVLPAKVPSKSARRRLKEKRKKDVRLESADDTAIEEEP